MILFEPSNLSDTSYISLDVTSEPEISLSVRFCGI